MREDGSVSKSDLIEQAPGKLAALRSAPADPTLLNELRGFLRNRSNLVVARAAKIVGQRRLADLMPELVTAFHKLMADPARLDKRCAALTEIVLPQRRCSRIPAEPARNCPRRG